MIEFVSSIFFICVGIAIIVGTIALIVFVGLLILGMLDESGIIDFLIELRNHKGSA